MLYKDAGGNSSLFVAKSELPNHNETLLSLFARRHCRPRKVTNIHCLGVGHTDFVHRRAQLPSFVGFANYYSQFVLRFSAFDAR